MNNKTMLSYELYNIIIEYHNSIYDKLNIFHLTKEHENNIIINRLCYLDNKKRMILCNSILSQKKYKNLKEIDINRCSRVTDISCLKKLEKITIPSFYLKIYDRRNTYENIIKHINNNNIKINIVNAYQINSPY